MWQEAAAASLSPVPRVLPCIRTSIQTDHDHIYKQRNTWFVYRHKIGRRISEYLPYLFDAVIKTLLSNESCKLCEYLMRVVRGGEGMFLIPFSQPKFRLNPSIYPDRR